jgi:hypothetical protein
MPAHDEHQFGQISILEPTDVGEAITIDHLNETVDIEGEDRDFTSYGEAIAYLNRYRFGAIVHPDMERDNFVFMKSDGSIWFYEINIKDIEPVTPELNALFRDSDEWDPTGWGYMQGREFGLTIGGVEWFDEIRKVVEDQPHLTGPTI